MGHYHARDMHYFYYITALYSLIRFWGVYSEGQSIFLFLLWYLASNRSKLLVQACSLPFEVGESVSAQYKCIIVWNVCISGGSPGVAK